MLLAVFGTASLATDAQSDMEPDGVIILWVLVAATAGPFALLYFRGRRA